MKKSNIHFWHGRSKSVNGNYTVEASVVVSIIILSTSLLIYLSFFLYNKCILSQCTYIAAFEASIREEGFMPTEQAILENYSKSLEGLLVPGREIESSCNIGMDSSIVTARTNLSLPFSGIAKAYLGLNGWEIYVEKKSENLTGMSFIRACKKIESSIK